MESDSFLRASATTRLPPESARGLSSDVVTLLPSSGMALCGAGLRRAPSPPSPSASGEDGGWLLGEQGGGSSPQPAFVRSDRAPSRQGQHLLPACRGPEEEERAGERFCVSAVSVLLGTRSPPKVSWPWLGRRCVAGSVRGELGGPASSAARFGARGEASRRAALRPLLQGALRLLPPRSELCGDAACRCVRA